MSNLTHIWDTAEQYFYLQDLLSYKYFNSTGESSYSQCGMVVPCNGFEALQDNPALAASVIDYLQDLGVFRMRYLSHGEFAVVFNISDGQVLRLSVDSEEAKRPFHPAILQPILNHVIFDQNTPIRIEILPQIKDISLEQNYSNRIEAAELLVLRDALLKSYLVWHDVKDANVARLKDGTPVIIDGGAVSLPKDCNGVNEDMTHLSQWFCGAAARDFKQWKQVVYSPQILSGHVSNVFSGDERKAFAARLGAEHSITKMVELGMYRSEVRYILDGSSRGVNLSDAAIQEYDLRGAPALSR